jgi:hypothetical protein
MNKGCVLAWITLFRLKWSARANPVLVSQNWIRTPFEVLGPHYSAFGCPLRFLVTGQSQFGLQHSILAFETDARSHTQFVDKLSITRS